MRIARKLGKISNEVQTRTMRRLGFNRMAQWESMMRLRASIEKEVAPILAAKHAAEADCFQIKFKVTEGKATPVKVAAPRKSRKLEGYEYTRAWWDEAEKRERAAKKAGLLVEV